MAVRFPARLPVSLVLAATVAAGCAHKASSPKPLTPQSFYSNQGREPVIGEQRINEDQTSELNRERPTGQLQIPVGKPKPGAKPLPPATQPGASAKRERDNSFARGISGSSGQFQLIGCVVAVVNNTPIYANNVLTPLSKIFSQRARELSPSQFREFASGKIHERLQELMDDEVLFAAAQRGLSDEDRKLAEAITQKWRQDQITNAGGSLEIARSKVAADGDDFEELCKQQYRRNMIEVFRYKKIMPRIQVSTEDLRRYYDQHKDAEFTEHAAAHFRLLEVNKTKSGDVALDKIVQKLQRAKAGEDFKAMCASENDDSLLASVNGDLGWKGKGSLPPAMSKLEDAIWSLKAGQFTDVLQIGSSYYIAQLIEARPGRVRQFDEQPSEGKLSVQQEIEDKLRKEQYRDLNADITEKLIKDAVWTTDKEKFELCVDMAMQRYPSWRAAGATSKAE